MTIFFQIISTWYRLATLNRKSVEYLQNYQFRRFKKICLYAYQNVEMYRNLYDENEFNPADMRDKDDINNVPLIDKDFIRRYPLEKRISIKTKRKNIITESTSGSTGEPLEIWSDKAEGLIQSMKCVRFLMQYGYSIFDNTLQLWRDVHEPKKSILQKLGILKRDYISIMDNTRQKIDQLTKKRCDVLFASRSSLEILAEEIKERHVTLKPKILVSGCEILTEEQRKYFKQSYGCETKNVYGCNEIGNIAWECPQSSEAHKMHIEMETVHVSFKDVRLDNEGNRVGSIVVTNLENLVMPFVRYELGDLIRLTQDKKCCCDNTFPILGEIFGRNDDIIEFQDRRFNWHFFYNYFKDCSYIRKYKIVQNRAGKIEFRIRLARDTVKDRERCIEEIKAAFQKYLTPINITFVEKFDIVRTGKFKVIEKIE